MKVNELSKKTGIESHVIRYYSRIGLLKPQRDSNNGYKLYDNQDARRLAFIRRLQALGFSLTEIAELMSDYATQGCQVCGSMYEMLQQHIEQNRYKLEELHKLQSRMERALADWDASGPQMCEGSPACPAVTEEGCCDVG